MDLQDFETTTTYAIQAVYMDYWKMIPEKYRLVEKAQNVKPTDVKHQPLHYKDVEAKKDEPPKEDFYEKYCETMNKGTWFNVMPFYDPQLDFENRLHYKLTGIDYPTRLTPWFIITWNFGNGILRSGISRRRFKAYGDTPDGRKVSFDFMNSEMEITFAIYSNSMQGLMELQENIYIGKREKCTVDTIKHSILGVFPVTLSNIECTVNKLPRDKGTLCVLNLNVRINYPIIGNVRDTSGEIIKEIHMELDSPVYDYTAESFDSEPVGKVMLETDIITENTPDLRVNRNKE